MTIQELCGRAAKMLGWAKHPSLSGYVASEGQWLDAVELSDLNILLPEADRFCKERGYWWQITSKPGVDSYEVVIFGASYDKYWRENDPDRITAILKAVVAAGEKE